MMEVDVEMESSGQKQSTGTGQPKNHQSAQPKRKSDDDHHSQAITINFQQRVSLQQFQPSCSKQQRVDAPEHIQHWLKAFLSFSLQDRESAITALVDASEASLIQHLKNSIEPHFQRDFISLLPKELALSILAHLSPRDLLSAALVSRCWRVVCEDVLLWREVCIEHGLPTGLRDMPPLPGRSDEEDARLPLPAVLHRCSHKSIYMRDAMIRRNWCSRPLPAPLELRGHDDHVITCLSIVDDLVISGSDDNTLRIWNATDGEPVHTLLGHTGGVWCSVINEERRLIVSGSTDRTVRVWHIDEGTCLNTLGGHTSTVRCLALAGVTAVSGSRDTTLRLWDISTGECEGTLYGHTAAVRCVQFDGEHVVSGSYDYSVRIWDSATQTCLHTLEAHTNRVYSLQFDPALDIAVSGSMDTNICVWSVSRGELLRTLTGHKSLNSDMQLAGSVLISGNADSTVRVWNVLTGECLHTLSGVGRHESAVTGLQLLENGLLLTSSDDGSVKLWNCVNGTFVRNMVALDTGGNGGVIWRLRATRTRLVCAVGSRNAIEETRLLVIDFNAGYPLVRLQDKE